MGGVERRLQRLEQGGSGASEAGQWITGVEAAWARREGRAYTIAPAVAAAMSRPPRPGSFLAAVQQAWERRTGQEAACTESVVD